MRGAGCRKSPAAGLPAEEGPDKLGAAPPPHLRAAQSQATLGVVVVRDVPAPQGPFTAGFE